MFVEIWQVSPRKSHVPPCDIFLLRGLLSQFQFRRRESALPHTELCVGAWRRQALFSGFSVPPEWWTFSGTCNLLSKAHGLASEDKEAFGDSQGRVEVLPLRFHVPLDVSPGLYQSPCVHTGVCVCAYVCARWVDACLHTQSSSDGLEVTFEGVVWEPTCFKMNILMATMRLELL